MTGIIYPSPLISPSAVTAVNGTENDVVVEPKDGSEKLVSAIYSHPNKLGDIVIPDDTNAVLLNPVEFDSLDLGTNSVINFI